MNELISFIENLTEEQAAKLCERLPDIRSIVKNLQEQTVNKA